jgi:hypothetical protein
MAHERVAKDAIPQEVVVLFPADEVIGNSGEHLVHFRPLRETVRSVSSFGQELQSVYGGHLGELVEAERLVVRFQELVK